MKYYLGLDAGGTFTRMVLFNQDGDKVDTLRLESIHYMQVGFDGIQSILERGKNEFITRGYSFEMIAVAIGTAGYGNDSKIRAKIENAIWSVFPNALIMNDAQFAMVSALDNHDGVYLISGTGSIAMRKIGCTTDRRGGYGYLLGDEGSAFWIGRHLLSVFTQESDGRLPKSDFYYAMMEHFKLNHPYDLVGVVNEAQDRYRNFASEVSLVGSSCLHVDHVSEIYRNAGIELAKLANSFELNGKTKIAFGGGVLLNNECVRASLIEHIHEAYDVVPYHQSVEYAAYLLLNQKKPYEIS